MLQYLEQEASDRGLDGVMVSSTGCMKLCDHAPVVIVYPEGSWYHYVNESVADEILDAIENGTVAESHLIPA